MLRKTPSKYVIYAGSALLCILFYVGYIFSTHSWNQEIFIYLNSPLSNNVRNIAGHKQELLIAKGSHQKLKNQQHITSTAYTENTNDTINLYLGHLLVPSSRGNSLLACQKYHTVDVTFLASSISFDGETPKMVLQAECLFNPNQPLKIGPFFIPKKSILNAPVNQILFRSNNNIILFDNIVAFWPKKWILSKIRFFNDNKELIISFNSISQKEEDYFSFLLR